MRVFSFRDANRISERFTLLLVLGGLTLFSLVFVPIAGYAAELSVELRVTPPNIHTISPGKGPKRIHIQANTSRQQGIKFSWNLDDPGRLLQLTEPGTFYIPPDKFDGPSTEAIVTVIITDPGGKQATASVTFTIETPMPTPGPIYLQIRIRDIVLHSEIGFRIYEIENRYYLLKPGEQVIVKHIDVEGIPDMANIHITLEAAQGKTGPEVTYIAPDKPGAIDPVIISIVEKTTGKILAQKAIIMKTQRGAK